jgi:hypothetical protein
MFKQALLICMLLTSVMLAGRSLAAADEPTLHQIYQAAEAGRLNDAQDMMTKVLRDHPNSAKAHFVQAELLAKQGRLASAATELRTAERLAPGLTFAKPEAVVTLKRQIASSNTSARQVPAAHGALSAPASGIPWGLLLVGLGAIAAIIFFVRRTSQRNANVFPAAGGAGYGTGFGPAAPLQPSGAGGGGGVAPPVGPAAGGIGSGILGGLATGAALGAGMVAGQALAHRLTDGNRHEVDQTPLPATTDGDATPNDMGGTDFGVADNSSWDDSSSGDGDDWG